MAKRKLASREAARKSARILRIDPTRTVTLRRQYEAEMKRRLKSLGREIRTELERRLAISGRVTANVKWAYASSAVQLSSFMDWVSQKLQAGLLSIFGGEDHWVARYIKMAFNGGMRRVWPAIKPPGITGDFLQTAFSQPVAIDKVKLLAEQAYTDLKGITDDMSHQIAFTLSEGMIKGESPIKIGKELAAKVDHLSEKRAATIARTEIIKAHNEGTLHMMEEMGVQEVGIMVEWLTAGDHKVCPKCAALQGKKFRLDEAHGMLPLHPNCRCAWIPSNF